MVALVHRLGITISVADLQPLTPVTRIHQTDSQCLVMLMINVFKLVACSLDCPRFNRLHPGNWPPVEALIMARKEEGNRTHHQQNDEQGQPSAYPTVTHNFSSLHNKLVVIVPLKQNKKSHRPKTLRFRNGWLSL